MALETLDAKEVYAMLEENNIHIPIPCLKTLFSVVQPRKPCELRMGEFIKFSFDEKANKSKVILIELNRVSKADSNHKKEPKRGVFVKVEHFPSLRISNSSKLFERKGYQG